MPGTRLLAFASLWFDEGTLTTVFEPLVADWQREWLDAKPSHRSLVSMRGLAAFLSTLVALSPRILLSPPPASLVIRVATRVGVLAFALTVPLIASFVYDLIHSWNGAQPLPLIALLNLLPGQIVLTLAPAMMPGVDVLRRHAPFSGHLARRATAQLALLGMLATLVGIGWGSPYANQQFRNRMASASSGRSVQLSRGIHELSLSEIWSSPKGVPRMMTNARRTQELNLRLSVVAAPILFVWVRWTMLSVVRRKWIAAIPVSLVAIVTAVAFFALMYPLNGGFGPWLPHLVMVLGGIATLRWTRSTQQPITG
ncbi:MAG: hypothetical protein ABI665_15090 [Vicinamibacterales bacterium]